VGNLAGQTRLKIYTWGWQRDARFRYAVCGRRFGKTYLGAEEMRRAAIHDLVAETLGLERKDRFWNEHCGGLFKLLMPQWVTSGSACRPKIVPGAWRGEILAAVWDLRWPAVVMYGRRRP
jgi:hypothetical protein